MSKEMAFENRRFHIAAIITVLVLIVIVWISSRVASELVVSAAVDASIQPKFGSIESQDEVETSMTENDSEIEEKNTAATVEPPKPDEVIPQETSPRPQQEQPTFADYGTRELAWDQLVNQAEATSLESDVATALEEQPKSVNEMTSAEVERKVAEYKTWIAKGLIKVSFNYEQIPVGQMHKIADAYFLASRSYTYRTDRFGDSSTEVIGNPEIKGLAIGLSKYRSEWPAPAIELERNMGTLREAYFVVQDNVALELYRCIGRAGKDTDLENKTVSVEIALMDGAVVAHVTNIK